MSSQTRIAEINEEPSARAVESKISSLKDFDDETSGIAMFDEGSKRLCVHEED